MELDPTSTSPTEPIAILVKIFRLDVPEGSHGFLVPKTQHQSSYQCLQGSDLSLLTPPGMNKNQEGEVAKPKSQ